MRTLDVPKLWADVNAVLVKTSTGIRSKVKDQQQIPGSVKTFGRGLDLIGADLRKAEFKGADLRGAYLIAADMRGVDFTASDLMGADLRDADLRGADLTRALFLTQGQINSAKGDCNTKLPARLIRPRHWENW